MPKTVIYDTLPVEISKWLEISILSLLFRVLQDASGRQSENLDFEVSWLAFEVLGLGFEVLGLGFKALGLGFEALELGFEVS